MNKILMFIGICLLVCVLSRGYETLFQQPISAHIAVGQLDNCEIPAATMRSYQVLRNSMLLFIWLCVVIVYFVFRRRTK